MDTLMLVLATLVLAWLVHTNPRWGAAFTVTWAYFLVVLGRDEPDAWVPPEPGERHMPGMNFCGPGTNVAQRLAAGVRPTGPLDGACLEHDMWTEKRSPWRRDGWTPTAKEKLAADRALRNSAAWLASQGIDMPWSAMVAGAMCTQPSRWSNARRRLIKK